MKRASSGWLALPALAYLTVLFLVPVSVVLAYSLCRRNLYGGVELALSWEAWQMATDTYTLPTVARTLLLALAVTLFNLLLAYPCAAALARMPRQQRAILVLIISFPLVTSLLLRTYGW